MKTFMTILQLIGFLILGISVGDMAQSKFVSGGIEMGIAVFLISMWLFLKIETKK